MATMVTRMRLNNRLYVHCLSCVIRQNKEWGDVRSTQDNTLILNSVINCASNRIRAPKLLLRNPVTSVLVLKTRKVEGFVTNERCLCWLQTMNRLKLELDRPAAEMSQDRHTHSPQIFVEDRLVSGTAYWIWQLNQYKECTKPHNTMCLQ